MSAFYLDILKDRLYSSKKDSKARKAAQTVMYEVLMALTKLISPVLSFTAEEIWQMLPKEIKNTESILLSGWITENPEYINEELETKWNNIIKLRGEVNKVLEAARRDKVIGHSLNAVVRLYADNQEYIDFLKANEDKLEDVFIISKVEIAGTKDDTYTASEEIKGLYIKADKAPGEKCERCWKYSEELGKSEEHPLLCPRCTEVLAGK